MKNILNQLIQLQELNFALAEQKASNSQMPLAQLEEAIAEVIKQLPPATAERYRRLQERYPLAVTPLMHSTCSQCGLTVPPAVFKSVRAGEQIQSCRTCGRFLYLPAPVCR